MKSPFFQTFSSQNLLNFGQIYCNRHQILQRARRIYLPSISPGRFLILPAKFFLWIFENFFPGHFWNFSDFSILFFSEISVNPLQHFDVYYRFRPCSFRCNKNFHPFPVRFSAGRFSARLLFCLYLEKEEVLGNDFYMDG